jgi:thiol-disulfide isomerase/thioredoxin
MLKAFIFLMILLVLPCVCFGQEVRQSPPVALRDTRGRTVRLSAYRGKVVLLNFWATWCPPCRAEMPDLIKLQREYGARGLQIVGITYPPSNSAEVGRFISRLKVNYPILYGTRRTPLLFNLEAAPLPATVLIDREGNVRDRILGILEPEEFEQKILPFLK